MSFIESRPLQKLRSDHASWQKEKATYLHMISSLLAMSNNGTFVINEQREFLTNSALSKQLNCTEKEIVENVLTIQIPDDFLCLTSQPN